MIILSKNSSAMFVPSVLLPCVFVVCGKKIVLSSTMRWALYFCGLRLRLQENCPITIKLLGYITAPPAGNTQSLHKHMKFGTC